MQGKKTIEKLFTLFEIIYNTSLSVQMTSLASHTIGILGHWLFRGDQILDIIALQLSVNKNAHRHIYIGCTQYKYIRWVQRFKMIVGESLDK